MNANNKNIANNRDKRIIDHTDSNIMSSSLPESPVVPVESKTTEKVLCIRRVDFPVKWVEKRSVMKMDEHLFFNSFSSRKDFNLYWVDRPFAEKESMFKQIIPYVLIQAANATLTAIYKREGNEKRLHDLWSMGIGGHINPLDKSSNKFLAISPTASENHMQHNNYLHDNITDFRQLLYSGMNRELAEELLIRPETEAPPIFLGTINEDITDVGKVHFGVVFKISADSPEQFIPGEELVGFEWIETKKLLAQINSDLNMELWSEMAVELL